MSALLFVASIWFAARGIWWAGFVTFVMGLAFGYDHVVRQRETVRRRDARLVAELRRNHHDEVGP